MAFVDIGGLEIYYEQFGEVSSSTAVLLLHGMRFSSKTWLDLKTLEKLAEWKFRSIAVDLPGYGKSKDTFPPEQKGKFLSDLCVAFSIEKAIVISPSMSGQYSLPFVHEFGHKVQAYIPIAPVETEKYSQEAYGKVKTPTFIVYGANDELLGEHSLNNLKQIPGNRVIKMKNAGHACYLDQPEEWHGHLKEILSSL
uniref:Protein ABHD14B-like n=1 Tax=Ciona intestinalis TaxID=7719 RepID=F6QCP0_CIOIN|nr:protein ABHD14B-like [Ciona intestinalis]|eukprot:XP_004226140.1 protein ABHD14B-like [Ciona intestinalis]